MNNFVTNVCDTCIHGNYCSERRGACTEYKNRDELREEVINAGRFFAEHPELDPDRQVQDGSGGNTECQQH